jgi:predicted transcriptional regulator
VVVVNSPVEEKHRRLVHVKYAVAAVHESELSLAEAVSRAVEAGVPWSEVASAVGQTEDAARERFGTDN